MTSRCEQRIAAFVSRHAPTPEQRADLAQYQIIQVNPPGRIEPRRSWLDICIACNGRPDLIVPILPHDWLTPFVKHCKRMSPQTRIIRPAIIQYDGERWDWNGEWME